MAFVIFVFGLSPSCDSCASVVSGVLSAFSAVAKLAEEFLGCDLPHETLRLEVGKSLLCPGLPIGELSAVSGVS